MANSFTLASALDRVRGNPSLSHSAVSSPDPESARDFLFAAHLVAARDSHNFSGRTCVDNLEMEGHPSLVAQSALSNHSRLVDCTRLVRAPESLRVEDRKSTRLNS